MILGSGSQHDQIGHDSNSQTGIELAVTHPILNQNFITNMCFATEEISVVTTEDLHELKLLNRLNQEIFFVTFIVPTTSLITALVKINKLPYLELLPHITHEQKNALENPNEPNNDFGIFCYKRSFGRWKIILKGTKHEIDVIGAIILSSHSIYLDYITIELSRSKYYQLCALKVLQENDITLIPTGYLGYLVNIRIHNESISSLLNELIEIYNNKDFPLVQYHNSIGKKPFLCSTEDLSSVNKSMDQSIPKFNMKPCDNIEKQIRLTKPEIGFLIGRKGERINEIRHKTGCKITISPVPINEASLLANKKVHQTVKLVGTPDKVEDAFTMINVNLAVHRDLDINFI